VENTKRNPSSGNATGNRAKVAIAAALRARAFCKEL
jgi:hypothetical protein